MTTSLHIGKHRVVTVTASDGSAIALGALNAVGSGSTGIVTVSVDAATNNVTVTGIGAGTCGVVYSATGYQSNTENFTVAPLPTLIFTDGPEI